MIIKWKNREIRFEENQLIQIMLDVLDFLSILHENNFYYGDLKP